MINIDENIEDDLNWIPDWKDKTAYPKADFEKVPRKRWAWEFLRRNPEYQKDYKKYSSYPEMAALMAGRVENRDQYFDFGSPIGRDESILEYTRRVESAGSNYGIWPKTDEFRDKYHVWGKFSTFNPANSTPPKFVEMAHPMLLKFQKGSQILRRSAFPRSRSRAAVIFNLKFDIKSQIEESSKLLKEVQNELREEGCELLSNARLNLNLSLYPNCLRVLDAFSSGADIEDIAEQICPGFVPNDYHECKEKGLRGAKEMLADATRRVKRLKSQGNELCKRYILILNRGMLPE